MPTLVRMYIRHVVIGLVLAIVFTGLLLGFNIAHLRDLILTSPEGWMAVAMLIVANAIVFGGVQFAIAIMRMGDDEDPPSGGRRDAVPVAVPVSTAGNHRP